ncbi:MAG: DUF1385 domain-containing protein [Chthonomonadales bacterium]
MSDTSQKTTQYLQYGGQAVIEGVMMRSPRFFAVACRKPDGGIVVQQEPLERSIVGKLKWMNKPLLRGSLALIDAMALGMKALNFAANVQTKALEKPTTTEDGITVEPEKPSKISDIAVGATMVFSICFGIGLFIALPTLLTQFVQGKIVSGSPTRLDQSILNLVDGVIRITIFLGYIAMISRLENIRRVFQFHGAEHKAINALEAKLPLTVENCMAASRIHPRCGTSFIIVVLIASILVHSVFPRPEMYWQRLLLHIALIPIVAGIAFEVIKLAGKYKDVALTRWLLAPGLWSQLLTTREPDVEHLEVAIASLEAVLNSEKEEDALKATSLATAPA